MAIVAFVSDLIFDSKLTSAAEALGIALQTTRSAPTALAWSQSASGLIVDVDAGPDAVDLVREARAQRSDLRMTAFVSHIQLELAAQAREAGADEVLSRSAFTRQMPEILSRLAT